MKNLTCLLAFFFVAFTCAQDTTQIQTRNDQRSNQNIQKDYANQYEVRDTTRYSMGNQSFTFTPEEFGVRVRRMENGEERDYGFLRRTTTDGFYIMTSTATNDTSFGRFDENGNLRTYRYDPDNEAVIEEDFLILDPVERSDQNRRNIKRDQKLKRP